MTASGIKEVVDVVLLFCDTSCFQVGVTRALAGDRIECQLISEAGNYQPGRVLE